MVQVNDETEPVNERPKATKQPRVKSQNLKNVLTFAFQRQRFPATQAPAADDFTLEIFRHFF